MSNREEVLGEEAYEIARAGAYRQLIEEGWDENDPDFERVLDESSDSCHVKRIKVGSALHSLLEQWYANQGKDMAKSITGYCEYTSQETL